LQAAEVERAELISEIDLRLAAETAAACRVCIEIKGTMASYPANST
jgi:hypothetical protein